MVATAKRRQDFYEFHELCAVVGALLFTSEEGHRHGGSLHSAASIAVPYRTPFWFFFDVYLASFLCDRHKVIVTWTWL